MLFRDVQKKRLEILMKIDSELQELEPLFYSEVSDGEFVQFTKVKMELQKLTRAILSESMQEINGINETDIKVDKIVQPRLEKLK